MGLILSYSILCTLFPEYIRVYKPHLFISIILIKTLLFDFISIINYQSIIQSRLMTHARNQISRCYLNWTGREISSFLDNVGLNGNEQQEQQDENDIVPCGCSRGVLQGNLLPFLTRTNNSYSFGSLIPYSKFNKKMFQFSLACSAVDCDLCVGK